jgi:hypothetical protein
MRDMHRIAKPETAKAAHPGPCVLKEKLTGVRRETINLKDTDKKSENCPKVKKGKKKENDARPA